MNERALNKIACWHDVTPEMFANEISPLNKPAILKGVVNNWPAVQQAQRGIEHLYQYFSDLYVGGDVRFARIAPEEKGRFFYNKEMTDFNFKREVGPLDVFLREVLANSSKDDKIGRAHV